MLHNTVRKTRKKGRVEEGRDVLQEAQAWLVEGHLNPSLDRVGGLLGGDRVVSLRRLGSCLRTTWQLGRTWLLRYSKMYVS